AQILTVKIVDAKGQPIPHTTCYIREIAQGLVADELGEFQLKINAGDYTLDISSLGFERKAMTVTIPPEGLSLSIELEEKTFLLQEVSVTPGKEDPAFSIMRNVIARAPYYHHQVKSFESDVYFKGTFIVDKIPALIKRQIKDPNVNNMIGKLMVYESQNELNYTQPDKYEQRVVAISTSIPEDFDLEDNLPINAFMTSIYNPKAFGGLMGAGSFSVYQFRYEDSYREGDHLIYKIRIIPRKNNMQLVNGYLYVVDGTWAIQRANITQSQAGVTIQLNLVYQEVKPGAFLTSACDVNIGMSVLGIKGSGQFYASVKYNQLETNEHPTPAKPQTTPVANQAVAEQPPVTKKQQQNLQKIEELAAKEKLSNRDAYKMAQLIEQTVEPVELKQQRQSLELRSPSSITIGGDGLSVNSKIRISRDSLALLRDSSYWAAIRTQPLRIEEMRSYSQHDSLRSVFDATRSADSLKNRTFGKWAGRILLGEKIDLSKKVYFRYNGLLAAFQDYNFVDGFRIGQRIETGVNFNRNYSFSISPAVYYTTARKEIDYVIDGNFSYAPLRNGRFTVSTGNTIADHAGNTGTGSFGNTLASILYAGNTAMFYQKRFLTVANDIDLANGLRLTTRFNYERRNNLENTASYNLFNKTPNPNRPHGHDEPLPGHEAIIANIGLEYTPRLYYRISDGRKHYVRSDYPTFRLRYNRGFSGNSDIYSSFENIEATIIQSIRLNLFDNLFYAVNAGVFLSDRKTYLPDYKHFQTNEMFLSDKSFNTSFTMDNYRYATNEKWVQGFVTYSTQYLLLKQIPFMQRYLFDEAVYLKTLWTPAVNFNEAGYSIGLGDLRIGVFAGFKKMTYENVGITITLPFLSTVSK
ncbi:MAG: DUF5686 and carboxypeptidase regulatory-like domain-containing protein, partial [Tannerella sp.]|nr:DUF5686 and carboxypeptidase regulatory-like domain-containing protein [Tannerella sp.]